ncbi:MAG: CotH kinase family protein [Chitinophagaceae bacterium]
MKKLLLAVNLFVLLLMGCKKDVPVLSPDNALLTFQFTVAGNIEEIPNDLICNIYDTLVVGVTGNNNSRSTLVADFTSTGILVSINGVTQVSGETINDFTNPVIYSVKAENGAERKYTVKLKTFTGLPIIYITTESPVVSKDDYVKGNIVIDGNFDFTEGLYDGKIEIRGRGNSTWYADKKPYKIKLSDKAGLFGNPSDKEWAILANWYDKSLIRNDVSLELSERLQREWTPKRNFTEVFMNGSTNGNYLLTETIKSGKGRVNIDAKNGGYLIEANYKEEDGDPRFYTRIGIPFDVKEGTLAIDSIKLQVDNVYDQLQNHNFDPFTGYQKDFDLDAFVSWYLVNELILNNDARFFSSVFLQKDNRTSKLKMGPVWDFDLSSGNVNYGQINPEGWYLMYGEFIQQIWLDPAFQAAVKAKWLKYRSQIISLPEYITRQGKYLDLSAKNNFQRWDILNQYLPNTVKVFGTYQGEVDYLKSWLTTRIAWMDKEINK